MRRVMLLALLVFALPTALLASSTDPITINFGFSGQGSFMGDTLGTATSFDLGTGPFTVSFKGAEDESGVVLFMTPITLTPTTLSLPGDSGPITLTKSWSDALGDFTETFTSFTREPSAPNFLNLNLIGTLSGPGGVTEPITASLTASIPLTGTAIGWSFQEHAEGVSAIPEPGTLGLLGTGMISLAGLVRRKLKVGA